MDINALLETRTRHALSGAIALASGITCIVLYGWPQIGGDSPGEVVQRYFDAIAAEDYSRACEFRHEDVVATMEESGGCATLTEQGWSSYDVASVEVDASLASVNGDDATVPGDAIMLDGQPYPVPMSLTRDGGDWYITEGG